MRYRLARRATPRTTPFARAQLAPCPPRLLEVLDALLCPGAYTLEMEGVPATVGPLCVLVVHGAPWKVGQRGTRPRRLIRPDGVEADGAVGKGRRAQGMCEGRGEVVTGRFSGLSSRLGLGFLGGRRLVLCLRLWRFCERRPESLSARWAGWV